VGPRPTGGVDLVEALDLAGLTGHGGAHFPTAVKWRAALARTGSLTVVANGAESEPLAAKDGTLLRRRPHLVLDGLALAVEALGADGAVVWLHGDDDGARRSLARALAERRWGPGHGPEIRVVAGPAHYLAGEAGAIARAVEGGPALPRARRAARDPGAPRTLVQNVETLARVALVARGLTAMATTLLTVLTTHERWVLEVGRGTPVATALATAGAALDPPPRAVLLGGYGGSWARWSSVADAELDEPALRAAGLSLGAGVLAPLPAWACGLGETAAIARYLAAASARQCGPCLFGLPALADAVGRLARAGGRAADLRRLAEDLALVGGRGACRHPDGAVRVIASALDVFADDVVEHLAGRACGRRAPALPVATP
jgi:NADH:ubiquinone oxidoreductase subunit F (NADH-binding)